VDYYVFEFGILGRQRGRSFNFLSLARRFGDIVLLGNEFDELVGELARRGF
jgi:hypothetical protein